MIGVENIQMLALEMLERRDREPPVLFLGAGCARAAGVPSLEQMAFRVFSDYARRDRSILSSDYMSIDYWESLQDMPEDERDYGPLREAFFELMSGMSGMARYGMLKRFYGPIPVPRFYQDLARLVKDRYFSDVLTTSIDTLLEDALGGIGLQVTRDYQVINLGADPSQTSTHSTYDTVPPTTIIKLHGDLAQYQVLLSPDEIEGALKHGRALVKGELRQDTVVVGYDFESEPVNRWLSWTPGRMWWVNPEQPTGEHRERLEQKRDPQYIDGPNAHPAQFFGVLLTMLQRQPLSLGPESLEDWELVSPEGLEFSKGLVGEGLPAADELEAQYLHDQLRSSEAVLSSLEQRMAVEGKGNLALEAQIDYQRREVAKLETQLRELSYEGSEVVRLIRRIANSLNRQGGDPGAVTFLRKQANTVKAEYGRAEPNQDVVSAAIGASAFLASRLDPDLVDRSAVQDLASAAPGAVMRGF
jgi:hypothetical protein